MSLKYSRFDSSELEDIDKMLHLTLYRNHNQHRLAKWWKAFQILKRNISKLLMDLSLHKKTPTKHARVAIEDRVAFILEFLVPKCYSSFSTVVADQQFASLGLMLMSTLARLNKIIIPLQREVVVMAPKLVEEIDPAFEEIGELVMRSSRGKVSLQMDLESDRPLKMEKAKSEKKSKKAVRTSSMLSLTDDTPSKPSKKKRKKGNAINDLFSSIL